MAREPMLFEDMHFTEKNRLHNVVNELYPTRAGFTNIIFRRCTFDYDLKSSPFTQFNFLRFEDCKFNVDQIVDNVFHGDFKGSEQARAIMDGNNHFRDSSHIEIENVLVQGDLLCSNSEAIKVKSSEIIGKNNLFNITGVDLLCSTMEGEEILSNSKSVLVMDSKITGNTPFIYTNGVYIAGNTNIKGYGAFYDAENVFVYSPNVHISTLVPPKHSIIVAGSIDQVVGKVPRGTKLFALKQGSVPSRSVKIVSKDAMPPLENIDLSIGEYTIQKKAEEFAGKYKR
jgi:hypothetical protein